MDNVQINFLAVFVASVAGFLLGAIWYSPLLFYNAWLKECGFTEEELRKNNLALIYGSAFVLQLIMALCLAPFLGAKLDTATSVFYSALTVLGWIAPAIGILYLFERRSMKLFFINTGYLFFNFVLMGLILGIWK